MLGQPLALRRLSHRIFRSYITDLNGNRGSIQNLFPAPPPNPPASYEPDRFRFTPCSFASIAIDRCTSGRIRTRNSQLYTGAASAATTHPLVLCVMQMAVK